jgi:hypothetical protein
MSQLMFRSFQVVAGGLLMGLSTISTFTVAACIDVADGMPKGQGAGCASRADPQRGSNDSSSRSNDRANAARTLGGAITNYMHQSARDQERKEEEEQEADRESERRITRQRQREAEMAEADARARARANVAMPSSGPVVPRDDYGECLRGSRSATDIRFTNTCSYDVSIVFCLKAGWGNARCNSKSGVVVKVPAGGEQTTVVNGANMSTLEFQTCGPGLEGNARNDRGELIMSCGQPGEALARLAGIHPSTIKSPPLESSRTGMGESNCVSLEETPSGFFRVKNSCSVNVRAAYCFLDGGGSFQCSKRKHVMVSLAARKETLSSRGGATTGAQFDLQECSTTSDREGKYPNARAEFGRPPNPPQLVVHCL